MVQFTKQTLTNYHHHHQQQQEQQSQPQQVSENTLYSISYDYGNEEYSNVTPVSGDYQLDMFRNEENNLKDKIQYNESYYKTTTDFRIIRVEDSDEYDNNKRPEEDEIKIKLKTFNEIPRNKFFKFLSRARARARARARVRPPSRQKPSTSAILFPLAKMTTSLLLFVIAKQFKLLTSRIVSLHVTNSFKFLHTYISS